MFLIYNLALAIFTAAFLAFPAAVGYWYIFNNESTKIPGQFWVLSVIITVIVASGYMILADKYL